MVNKKQPKQFYRKDGNFMVKKRKSVYVCDHFFKRTERIFLSLSFDDVSLHSGHTNLNVGEANITTKFSKNIKLNIPYSSAAMDRVTEHKMAIIIAMLGGIGIIHKGMAAISQAKVVARVKKHMNGLIDEPICIRPNLTMEEVLQMLDSQNFDFRSLPVTDNNGKLLGLITGNNFKRSRNNQLVKDVMTKRADLITATPGTSIKKAYKILEDRGKNVLPLLRKNNTLAGMYAYSDLSRILFPTLEEKMFNVDKNKNLIVGAAVGIYDDAFERAELLIEKGVDVLVVDTAHADTISVIETVKMLKKKYSIDIVAGNISNSDSAKRLLKAGADGIKVGQGPGSICTTRIVSGYGIPQLSAIYDCAKAIRGSGVPIIGDGGIKYSGDIVKALAAGAHSVMLGSLFAGTDESPGDTIMRGGKKYKEYRGMGSLGAMKEKGAAARYGQDKKPPDKLVPEGAEGLTNYKGKVEKVITMLNGGVQSGMFAMGAKNIFELHKKAKFTRISAAGLRESHIHELKIENDPPNYRKEDCNV